MRPYIQVMRRALAVLTVALAAVVMPAQHAQAQTCSVTMSNASFGAVDLTQNALYDTTASYTAACSGGSAGQTLRLCINLGAGSGGASGANAPRHLASAGNTLGYNLYLDAARTSVWGAYTGGGDPKEIVLTLDGSGQQSAGGSMFATLFANQSAAPTGTYTSSFAASASLSWDDTSAGDCTAIGATQATAFSFQASASYAAACTVSVGTMNFGTITQLQSAIETSASITTTCSAASPYTIGLGDGLHATGAMQRRMAFGASRLTYELYQDSGRITPWGNAPGDRKAATGSGGTQVFTVYGRVPSQSEPVPGVYNDTVIVTVSY